MTRTARRKILLVDDSNTAIMIERMLLRSAPYDIVVARDGREAVAVAERERPDLIVMDVMMPNMTGLEACQALRAKEDTRDIPIILVTTRGEPESIDAGFDSGCSDYVMKPIDGQELLSKIGKHLGE